MKLLSWNFLHGGGTRLPQIGGAIIAHDPDVIALSEFRTKPGAVLCARLNTAGWPFAETTGPVGSDNGIAVLSRAPVVRARPCSRAAREHRPLAGHRPA
jgi:exonuclease III